MAFKTGYAGDRQPAGRTYLVAVQRVIRSCGEDPPTSITGSQSNHVERAKAAVDDALQRVYNACLWDFRGRWGYLAMENNIMWYQLPADWAARATDLLTCSNVTGDEDTGGITNDYGPVRFVDYQRLIKVYPWIAIPIDTQVTETDLAQIIKMADLKQHQWRGVPEHFTIFGDMIGIYPIPDIDLDDEEEGFSMNLDLLVAYWGFQKDLSLNDDMIPLPTNLLEAHHNLALSRYKQSLEYSDYVADEQRGEGMLALEVAKYLQKAGDTQFNHVSEWGEL